MEFNIKKCKHMPIGNSNQHDNFCYKMGTNEEISKCSSEKDIGVTFDHHLKFSQHVNNSVSKANRITGLIFKTFSYINKDMFLNLYKTLVMPHLEYGSCVWNQVSIKDQILIENVQRRTTKRVKGLNNLTYEQRLRSLGIPSLQYRRKRADIVQVYKIINDIDIMDKDKLFTMSPVTVTRGHSKKIMKRGARLNVTKNKFNSRTMDTLTGDKMARPIKIVT
ncbi:uncharacterized protein B0403.1-like [Argopecten irradians]|uniref:uncharacterized protein B0403.1-like n=1 Tax=Argopecten irradians TaxID=31199 RepID=UPI0037145A75